ncbi:MAG: hypothetical protein WC204_01230, partial [Elusimicrobiales bacterium]
MKLKDALKKTGTNGTQSVAHGLFLGNIKKSSECKRLMLPFSAKRLLLPFVAVLWFMGGRQCFADYSRGLILVSASYSNSGQETAVLTRNWYAVRMTVPRDGTISSFNTYFRRASNTTWQVCLRSVDPDNPDQPLSGDVIGSTVSINANSSSFFTASFNSAVYAGDQIWLTFYDNTGTPTQDNTNYPAFLPLTTDPRNIVGSDVDSADGSYLVRYSTNGQVDGWVTASNRMLISTILYDDSTFAGNSYTTLRPSSAQNNVYGANWTEQFYQPASSFYLSRLAFYGAKTGANPAGDLYADIYEDVDGANRLVYIATATKSDIGTTADWQFFPDIKDPVYFNSAYRYGIVFRSPSSTSGVYYRVYSYASSDTTSPRPDGTWGGTVNRARYTANSGGSWTDTILSDDLIVKFVVDTTKPQQGMTLPVNTGIYDSAALPYITGTASDNYYVGKSTAVALKIQRLTQGVKGYWTGSTWQSGEAWVYVSTPNALASMSWRYPTAGWMEQDRKYRIEAKAYDPYGNISVAWSTAEFTCDSYQASPELPDSRFLVPADGVYFDQLTSISGTAKDDPNHGAVQTMYYYVKDTAAEQWWGGSGFNKTQESDGQVQADTLVYDPPNLKYDWSSSINIMNSVFENGKSYAFYGKASDYTLYPHENFEAVYSTNTAICDRAAPISVATMPANGARYNSIPTINGTAWDQTSGVNSVYLRLKRLSDGYYWNNSAQQFDDSLNANTAWTSVLNGTVLGNVTTGWALIMPAGVWSDGASYEMQSRAIDRVTLPAPHYEVSYTTVTFTYDTTVPVPVVTVPASLGYITAPLGLQTTMQGTVDADTALVEMRLQDLTRGTTYWDETAQSWTNAAVWNTAQIYSPGYWRMKISSAAFVSGKQYEIYMRATDQDLPSANVGYSATQRFWYDVDKPTSAVTGITDGAILSGLPSITGTAWETASYGPVGSSLGNVNISIFNTQIGQYFTGSGWGLQTPLNVALDAGALNAGQNRWEHTWSITPSTGWINDYTYEIRWLAADKAGNIETGSLDNPGVPSLTFTIDKIPPTMASTSPVDGGRYGAGAWNIYGTAQDNQFIPQNGVSLFIKEEGADNRYWTPGGWAVYATGDEYNYAKWVSTGPASGAKGATVNWTYTNPGWSSNSRYTIWGRVVDAAGSYSVNWSTTVFYYDTTAPSSQSTAPVNNAVINSLTAIGGTAHDNSRGGINSVRWVLWRNSDEKYWDTSAGWTPGPIPSNPNLWFSPNDLQPPLGTDVLWSRTTLLPAPADMTDGTTYYLTTAGIDITSTPGPNTEVSRSTATFWWDTSAPVSRSTAPADGSRYSSLPVVSGTAFDNVRIDSLRVRIRRNTDLLYWNAAADDFTADEASSWIELGSDLALRTTNWSYTDAFAWVGSPPTQYQVNIQAKDYLRYETAFSTAVFTYDRVAPVAVITEPASLGYLSAPLGLQTTAQGTIDTDTALVEVRLRDLTRGATYWNETTRTWTDSVVYNTGIYSAGTWRMNISSAAFVGGRKYELGVRGTDSSLPAGNTGSVATQQFWYDVDKPTAAVTGMTDGAVLFELSSITGTAWDTSRYSPVGTSMDKVNLSLYNVQLDKYFTGSGWGGQTPLNPVLDAGTENGGQNRWEHAWSINLSTGLINDYNYEIRWQAVDKAGNAQNNSLDTGSTPKLAFTIDRTPPVAIATFPANGGVYSAGSWNIYGTASDNQGLDKLELCLKDTTGSKYWNGSFWEDDPGFDVWFSSQDLQNLPVKTADFYYSGINWQSSSYRLSARSRDDVGLWQSAITTVTFTIDTQNPASGVSLPAANGYYNNSNHAIASIQGTSTDDKSGIPNGGVEVWIRALGPAGELQWPTTYWNGTAWQESGTPLWRTVTLAGSAGDLSRSWTYSTPNFSLLSNGGSGHRFRVQVKAKDTALNQQVPSVENYFEYDVQLPTSAVLTPADATKISRWQYLTGQARDPYPGTGLDLVQLQIIDRGTGNDADYNWWTGSGWTSTPNTWVTPGWTMSSGTDAWNWSFAPPSTLTSGRYYRVVSRARDKALNYDVTLATSTFQYDVTVPQSQLLDLRDYQAGDNTTYTDRLGFVHGEAWGETPVTSVAINIYDQAGRTWENGSWASGDTGYWNACSGKEYFVCSGNALPPAFGTGAEDFRGRIRSRALTASKTETAGAGRSIYMKKGVWPYSYVSNPAHGSYLTALPEINLKLSRGSTAAPAWARVRVENITDSTVVQDWTDAALGGFESFGGGNYKVYSATYTVGFSWTNNKVYRIRSLCAYNGGADVETAAADETDGVIVTFDQTNPSSRITVPAHGVTYNDLTQLSGTAGDNLSGVDRTEISIADLNQATTYYWHWWSTSGTWVTDEYFNTAVMPSTSAWTYSTLPAWTDGKVYNVRTRAYDKASNSEALPAVLGYADASQNTSRTFRYDTSGPSSSFSTPQNTAVYRSLSKIEGNSTDLYSVIPIGNSEISLQRDSNNWYWDPVNGWSAGSSQWFTADSTYSAVSVNWSYSFADTVWHSSYTYTARARSKDNTQTGANQGPDSSAAVFYIDRTNPISVITLPAAQPQNSVQAVSGTASDNRKMYLSDPFQAVKIRIYRAVGNVYWNAVARRWESASDPELYWSTAAFTYAPSQSSGTFSFDASVFPWSSGYTYRLESRARDSVDNYDAVYSTVTFKFDNTEPESTVVSPADGSHHAELSTSSITGSYTDPSSGSGVVGLSMYVQDLTRGTTYWTGMGWTDTDGDKWLFSNIVGGVWTWNAVYDPPQWTDGHLYRIVTRADDLATNQEGTGAGNLGTVRDAEFVYDISKPTGAVTYPYDKGYISQAGKITGTAYDAPNGIVEKVYVRIKQTAGSKPDHYWRVSDSSWTLENVPEVWNEIYQGGPYGTLSASATWWQLNTTPWQSGETYDISVNIKDKADNYRLGYSTVTLIKADFTPPTSTVTYPVNGSILQTEVTVISGSASDTAPGQLDKVQVSYYCASGICDGNYWNRASGLWNSGAEIFYDATLLAGDKWEATGSSTPTWVTSVGGIAYRVFAKAVDKALLEVAKPGAVGDGPYMEFTLKTPQPVSGITSPSANTPHWVPNPKPAISGTSVYSSTVAVRVTDLGADGLENGNDLVWNGTQWLSASANPDLYLGVDSFNPGNGVWQIDLESNQWNGNRTYRVKSKAVHTGNEYEETPGAGRLFVIDSSAPAAAVTAPDRRWVNSMTGLIGGVGDIAPGVIQNTYFRVKRDEASQYWNWAASTFTADAPETYLPAGVVGGVASYTTDYFLNNQAWEQNRDYVVQLVSVDKAGNTGTAAEVTFKLDLSSPTTRILLPQNAKAIRSLPSISGTAADDWENQKVEIAIQKWLSGTMLWFDGTSFSDLASEPHWLDVVNGAGSSYLSPDATTWVYAPANFDDKFESGYQYFILVRSS